MTDGDDSGAAGSSPPARRRCRVLVSGRVQGVGFRDTCRTVASRHGVAGFVRNLDDGDVEAVFEGARAAVDTLVEWCRRGPPTAVVRSVVVAHEEPQGAKGFAIR